jgi:hypothetical protein
MPTKSASSVSPPLSTSSSTSTTTTNTTTLNTYLQTSGLSSAVSNAVNKLIDTPLLPHNPYETIVRELRLEEIKGSLFQPEPVEATWLSSLKSGTLYGLYSVHSRRLPRKSQANQVTGISSLSLSPNHEGSVFGSPHVIAVLDSVGVVCVAKIVQSLTKTLYPTSMLLTNTPQYVESIAYSVLPPTVFHGNAFSSASLNTLAMNVEVTVRGETFEKAVAIYTKRILTELYSARESMSIANPNGVVGACNVTTITPSRRKGDGDVTKTWYAQGVKQNKKLFESTVKSSTVARKSITLNFLYRTCFMSASTDCPHVEPEDYSNGTVATKFIRVQRTFVLHFVDIKSNSKKSFAEYPGISLALGYFIGDNAEKYAKEYMELFAADIISSKVSRTRNVLDIVTQQMKAKESESEAVANATLLYCGAIKDSPLYATSLYDNIVTHLTSNVVDSVQKRDDYTAFQNGLCLALLRGNDGSLRDFWRMLCGIDVDRASAGEKRGIQCGVVPLLNRLKTEGDILYDCCKHVNDAVLEMYKHEKEFWNKRKDVAGKQKAAGGAEQNEEKILLHHKGHVDGVLANTTSFVGAVQNMFWSWYTDVINLTNSEIYSDANGLSDVLRSLMNEVGDVGERKMKVGRFPSYDSPIAAPAAADDSSEDEDTDSSDSDSDSDDSSDDSEAEKAPKKKKPTKVKKQKKPVNTEDTIPRLIEAEIKSFSETFRFNMKIMRRVSGLLEALERCAGLDVACLCAVKAKKDVERLLEAYRSEEVGNPKLAKVKGRVHAAALMQGSYFEKMDFLGVQSAIAVIERVLRGPVYYDLTVALNANTSQKQSAKVAPGGTDNKASQELLFSIRWTFDRQKIREMDPGLTGLVVDVEMEGMAAAVSRCHFPAPVCKEGVVMQYLVDARVDQSLKVCFERLLSGALVSNPFPSYVSKLRSCATRLAWQKGNDEILFTVLGLEKDPEPAKPFTHPYRNKTWDGFVEERNELEGKENGERGSFGLHRRASTRPGLVSKVNARFPIAVADASTGTRAMQVGPGTAVFGSKEALSLCLPVVADHALNLLPKFTGNLRVPEPTTALDIVAGHSMRAPHLMMSGRFSEKYKLPTFMELQTDFYATFPIAKTATKVTSAFASHVINVCVELHERSRHLVLGLAVGKGAYVWGSGRFKFSVAQLKSKKEYDHIVNTISHYQTSEIAIHCLMLTPPLPEKDRGELDCESPMYVPSIVRYVLYRQGPANWPGEPLGIKKNSELPSWLNNDPGGQFSCVHSSIEASMSNANRCGRTEWDLGGDAMTDTATGVHKQRILIQRGRHAFVEKIKDNVESMVMEGDIVEAYAEFCKLTTFNLEKKHAIHFEDPEDATNDSEYIPSIQECCSGMFRMVNSVAGEIKRLEGLVRALAVLIDNKNLSGYGLPVTYIALPTEVMSRINPGCLGDMCRYFVQCAKRILTSADCLVMDGACRSCLSLLPRLEAEVDAVVLRVKTGDKLFEGEDGAGVAGEVLANIVELLESVKLVAANDVHGLLVGMQQNFRDLDDNVLL